MKKIISFILLITCIVSLVACESASNVDSHISLAGEVEVFFLGADGVSLVTGYIVSDESTVEERVEHVINAFQNPPVGYNSVYSKEIPIIDHPFKDGIITLHCSADYVTVPAAKEILWRTAIVKTLVNIDGVDGVEIFIADQPLMDAKGNVVGVLTADSFEATVNHKLGEIVAKLYFSDVTGSKLVSENRLISYPLDESVEYYIVNALINGPEENGSYNILSKSVILDEVIIKEGICYLYFEAGFLTDSIDVANEIPIYAIVNTLSELPNISRVQFVVEGVEDPKFRNTMSLAKPLSANLDLIVKG